MAPAGGCLTQTALSTLHLRVSTHSGKFAGGMRNGMLELRRLDRAHSLAVTSAPLPNSFSSALVNTATAAMHTICAHGRKHCACPGPAPPSQMVGGDMRDHERDPVLPVRSTRSNRGCGQTGLGCLPAGVSVPAVCDQARRWPAAAPAKPFLRKLSSGEQIGCYKRACFAVQATST